MCGFVRGKAPKPVARRKRIALWASAMIVAGVVILPLGGYLYTGLTAQAAAEEQTNPRANYWRAVREGNTGYTAVMGQETNVLIQNGGQNWRQTRNGPIANIGPWVLAVVVAVILVYFLLHGQVKMDSTPSGRMIRRWNTVERVLHWYTAILFIILAITGLSLLFGRAVLIPILGASGFAGWANFSILLHNYLGPFFVAGVAVSIIAWIKDTIPNSTDWAWIKQGGGMFGKGKHPHADRINAGEKILTFWVGMVVLGIAVSITGLMLLGWIGEGMRATMQTANLIHSIAATIWIALTLGHIYLGAWGVEGTLQGMWKGEVDEEWAKQHHDLWYEEGKKG